eukprot:GHVR01105107.1.p1 GENE.GHVR01105107.1~~GHVR01105107.1.p1  ORF type:complete len:274 (-),score=153.61 GHVR01105107.1:123-944(-)
MTSDNNIYKILYEKFNLDKVISLWLTNNPNIETDINKYYNIYNKYYTNNNSIEKNNINTSILHQRNAPRDTLVFAEKYRIARVIEEGLCANIENIPYDIIYKYAETLYEKNRDIVCADNNNNINNNINNNNINNNINNNNINNSINNNDNINNNNDNNNEFKDTAKNIDNHSVNISNTHTTSGCFRVCLGDTQECVCVCDTSECVCNITGCVCDRLLTPMHKRLNFNNQTANKFCKGDGSEVKEKSEKSTNNSHIQPDTHTHTHTHTHILLDR